MAGFLDFVSKEAGMVTSFVLEQWSQRMVQVSVYGAIVFYILSTGELLSFVEKQLIGLGLKVGKEGTRLLHSVIFAVVMYYGSRLILDPIVNKLHLQAKKNGAQ